MFLLTWVKPSTMPIIMFCILSYLSKKYQRVSFEYSWIVTPNAFVVWHGAIRFPEFPSVTRCEAEWSSVTNSILYLRGRCTIQIEWHWPWLLYSWISHQCYNVCRWYTFIVIFCKLTSEFSCFMWEGVFDNQPEFQFIPKVHPCELVLGIKLLFLNWPICLELQFDGFQN